MRQSGQPARVLAKLDQENRRHNQAPIWARQTAISDVVRASLNSSDRRSDRAEGMDRRIMAAALSGYR